MAHLPVVHLWDRRFLLPILLFGTWLERVVDTLPAVGGGGERRRRRRSRGHACEKIGTRTVYRPCLKERVEEHLDAPKETSSPSSPRNRT